MLFVQLHYCWYGSIIFILALPWSLCIKNGGFYAHNPIQCTLAYVWIFAFEVHAKEPNRSKQEMIAKGLLQPIQSKTILVRERQYPYGPYCYWSKVFTPTLQKLGTLCPNFVTNLVRSRILLHHISWIHQMFSSFCTYLWANMHNLSFIQFTRWI